MTTASHQATVVSQTIKIFIAMDTLTPIVVATVADWNDRATAAANGIAPTAYVGNNTCGLIG